MPRNQLIALVVGVCVLSAAIGSGLALLAQTGPHGPAGKQGPRGPQGKRGPAGQSAAGEVAGLEEEVGELAGQVESLESALEEVAGEGGDTGQLESRIEGLEEEVAELGGLRSELCGELEFIC
jgi:hypothetical protein